MEIFPPSPRLVPPPYSLSSTLLFPLRILPSVDLPILRVGPLFFFPEPFLLSASFSLFLFFLQTPSFSFSLETSPVFFLFSLTFGDRELSLEVTRPSSPPLPPRETFPPPPFSLSLNEALSYLLANGSLMFSPDLSSSLFRTAGLPLWTRYRLFYPSPTHDRPQFSPNSNIILFPSRPFSGLRHYLANNRVSKNPPSSVLPSTFPPQNLFLLSPM